MALHSLYCADVPFKKLLTHSFTSSGRNVTTLV